MAEVMAAIEDMVGEGLPPRIENSRPLAPRDRQLPDLEGLPPGLRLVLREIDRAWRPARNVARSVDDEPTAAVRGRPVAARRSMVLIGGTAAGAEDALEARGLWKDRSRTKRTPGDRVIRA